MLTLRANPTVKPPTPSPATRGLVSTPNVPSREKPPSVYIAMAADFEANLQTCLVVSAQRSILSRQLVRDIVGPILIQRCCANFTKQLTGEGCIKAMLMTHSSTCDQYLAMSSSLVMPERNMADAMMSPREYLLRLHNLLSPGTTVPPDAAWDSALRLPDMSPVLLVLL